MGSAFIFASPNWRQGFKHSHPNAHLKNKSLMQQKRQNELILKKEIEMRRKVENNYYQELRLASGAPELDELI